jgi:hypothetical protein
VKCVIAITPVTERPTADARADADDVVAENARCAEPSPATVGPGY